jgi:hypothetical protein
MTGEQVGQGHRQAVQTQAVHMMAVLAKQQRYHAVQHTHGCMK